MAEGDVVEEVVEEEVKGGKEALSKDDLDNIDDNDIKGSEEEEEVDDPGGKPEGDDHWSKDFKDEKNKKIASRYNTPEDAAKGILDMRSKLSKKNGPLGEDADEVEVADFRKAFNVPETPEGYEFPELPEGADSEENKENVSKWQGLFHKHHASKEMVADVLKMFGEDVIAGKEEEQRLDKQFSEDTDAEIRKDWGDNYDKNKGLANTALQHAFGDTYEDVKHIKMADGKFVMDHPAFVKAFSGLGREMSEGELGETLTEAEVDTVQEKADQYREKSKEEQKKGNTAAANKWAAKELAELEKLEKVNKEE